MDMTEALKILFDKKIITDLKYWTDYYNERQELIDQLLSERQFVYNVANSIKINTLY